MTENFDLFGDPVPDNHGRRGRPQHIATTDNCNKVKMLLALGWSNERIAKAMGITQPTFRRNYFQVLKLRSEMRDRLDAAYAMKIWQQVQEGNVGAMRLWAAFMDRNDAAVGHSSFYSDQRQAVADEAKPEKLGKKEQAALAAETAGEGSDWGEDLRPQAH